jgi:IS5 family transposase
MKNIQEFIGMAHNLAQRAVPKYSSKYSRKEFTQPQLITLNLLRIKCDWTYRGTVTMVRLMTVIREELGLDLVPQPSTLWYAFDRMKMSIGWLLLDETLEEFDLDGFAGIDATGFERSCASSYYASTTKMDISSVKTTVLADLEHQVVLDVHMTTTRKHDTQIGPDLLAKHPQLDTLVADKGYCDRSFRDQLRDQGIRPLVRHADKGSIHRAANARMDEDLYHQRSKNESIFSVIKRKYGDRIRARVWYRQFREIVLRMVVYNLDRLIQEVLLRILTIPGFQVRRQSAAR